MKLLCFTVVAIMVFAVSPVLGQRVEVPRELVSFPELIIKNAKLLTVDDPGFTVDLGRIAEAMAVRGGKILAVGTDSEISALAGPDTKVFDLKGRMVMPGMINTHDHPYYWVMWHEQVYKNVVGDDSIVTRFLHGSPEEQFQSFEPTLKQALEKAKPGQWISMMFDRGRKQEHSGTIGDWLRKESTRASMDQLTPGNPVMVGPNPLLLNAKAFEEYEKIYPDWENYSVAEQIGARGMRQSHILGPFPARRFFWDVLFRDWPDLADELLREELSWFAGYGNTTIGTTIEGYKALASHSRLDKAGKLGVRVPWGYSGPIFEEPFFLESLVSRLGTGSDYFWLIAAVPEVVLQSCTSLPGRTAAVKARERCALASGMPARDKMYALVKAGMRIGTLHSGGDQDIDYFLETIVRASRDAGFTMEEIRAKRHAFDHCYMAPRPDQIPVLKTLGIMLSCSDNQIWESLAQKVEEYGERAATMMTPRKSLTEAGVMHTLELDEALGSYDYNAFFFFEKAMTRVGQDGKVYGPSERVGREIMIKAATTWASYYVLREDLLGSLEPGKFADFIVLDQDLLQVPVEEIARTRVLMTVVGGEIVHLAPPVASEAGMSPIGAQVKFGPPYGQTGW